jgi:preprotein translocase subunit YajC
MSPFAFALLMAVSLPSSISTNAASSAELAVELDTASAFLALAQQAAIQESVAFQSAGESTTSNSATNASSSGPTIGGRPDEELSASASNDPSKTDVELGTTSKKKSTLLEELFANPWNYLLVLVIGLYVYLLFLRPNPARKEQREQFEKIKNLKKNDRVVTNAGIHGVVSNINNEAGTVTLRIDESTNTKMTVERMSIRSVAS